MSTLACPLDRLVQKFSTRADLSTADEAAVRALPYVVRSYHAATYVVREGERPQRYCDFIQNGFSYRQKLTASGARQIVAINLPGDFIDLQHMFLSIADHNVQALTNLDVVGVEREALQQLALAYPNVGKAMWVDALVEAAIGREWVLNVGQRTARARIAHILCEVFLRMKAAGLCIDDRFELPLTQEQLADATGMTTVHVNRTLKSLAVDGIIHRDKRYISFSDWKTVAAIGDFSALYLRLDQVHRSRAS
jgi:CRP-like cAMP-binding protein